MQDRRKTISLVWDSWGNHSIIKNPLPYVSILYCFRSGASISQGGKTRLVSLDWWNTAYQGLRLSKTICLTCRPSIVLVLYLLQNWQHESYTVRSTVGWMATSLQDAQWVNKHSTIRVQRKTNPAFCANQQPKLCAFGAPNKATP